MLAVLLACSTAALTTTQKVLSIRKLVKPNIFDLSDHARTGVTVLTSAADKPKLVCCYVYNHLLIRSYLATSCPHNPTNPLATLELFNHIIPQLNKLYRSHELQALKL